MLGSDESGENGSVLFKTLVQDFLYEASLISIIRTEIDHTVASLKTVRLSTSVAFTCCLSCQLSSNIINIFADGALGYHMESESRGVGTF